MRKKWVTYGNGAILVTPLALSSLDSLNNSVTVLKQEELNSSMSHFFKHNKQEARYIKIKEKIEHDSVPNSY